MKKKKKVNIILTDYDFWVFHSVKKRHQYYNFKQYSALYRHILMSLSGDGLPICTTLISFCFKLVTIQTSMYRILETAPYVMHLLYNLLWYMIYSTYMYSQYTAIAYNTSHNVHVHWFLYKLLTMNVKEWQWTQDYKPLSWIPNWNSAFFNWGHTSSIWPILFIIHCIYIWHRAVNPLGKL